MRTGRSVPLLHQIPVSDESTFADDEIGHAGGDILRLVPSPSREESTSE